MEPNTILVFSEKPTLLRELLGKARQMADGLGWTVGVVDFGEEGAALAGNGADVIYQVDANKRNPEIVLAMLNAAIDQAKPGIFLVGATKLGMEVAPRLAEQLSAGYAAWGVDLELDLATQSTTAQCMLYTGNGVATINFKPGMLILTVAQGVFETSLTPGKAASIVMLNIPETSPRMVVLDYKVKPAGGICLEEAKLVVDVGQGVKQREDLEMVKSLASLLDGQLTCSRPIASDRDWFHEWLGLSGAKVKPELCLAIGISGAIQHIIGIRDSRIIVAINNDEGASIFSQADYGVVTDLYEFVPVLIDRLKARGVRPMWLS